MLGINFVKLEPTVYALHYRNGRLVHEGAGLSLLYFAPVSTIVAVPLNTTDLPFAFQEVTADFQTVTLQGQLSFRVTDPKRLAGLLNYAVDGAGNHVSDDPDKLGERLMMAAQAVMRAVLSKLTLREALVAAQGMAAKGLDGLRASPLAEEHGLEILAFSLIALRPTPETAKALEAEAREALLREADGAIYMRRKAAVEQERTVKETELDTERIVEEKKHVIRETQLRGEIAAEEQRAELMDRKVVNNRKETDSRAYAIERTLTPYKDVDWKLLLALNGQGGDGRLLMAHAFERFAENSAKIGQLTITPDLLSLLNGPAKK